MSSQLITISPVNGQEYVRRDYTSQAEIGQVLARSRRAQTVWKAHTLEERCRLVSLAVDHFVANKAQNAEVISHQMGRPLRYTPGEVVGFEERARHMISIAPEALAPIHIPEQSKLSRYMVLEPVGTVLIVAPWNYPLLTAVNTIVPALVAGNPVILKHSDQTPLCAELLDQAFKQAGLPEGVFQFVHANHDTISRLIKSPIINFVSFTGSVYGGKAIEQASVGRFIGKGLELGGNDPAYVRADANLDHAVEALVDGAYFNSGQSCCGIQRVYVNRSVYKQFIDQAATLASQYVLGNPLDPDTTMGPVVRLKAAQEIRTMVSDAIGQGANNLIDPTPYSAVDSSNAYVAPALLVDVNHQMTVMNEECFGPVLGVMPVDSDEQAIDLMNDSPYGLTASVFTSDLEAAKSIGARVETGTFFMNRCDYLDPALAWTGVKNSGQGVTLSTLGYRALTQVKSFHLRTV